MILFILFFVCIEYSLSQVELKFSGSNSCGPYKLVSHIISGSEEVWIGQSRRVVMSLQNDYSIDYDAGIIYFNTPLSPSDTVYFLCKRIPFNLAPEYYHRELIDTILSLKITDYRLQITDCPTSVDTAQNVCPPSNVSNFHLHGTKTFGISVSSNRNFSFNHSMQINMDGELSDGIKVDGVLRDDSVPIQSAGTTQELKEMDELYVNVRRESSEIRFGDFDLNLSQSKFGKVNRKLEGVTCNINDCLSLSGALSKGRWMRKKFEGVLGKQGPYELSSSGIAVLGSEKICLNGIIMQRGEDYTIDYSTSILTFTTKRLIKNGDCITAEFQQNDDSYRRDLFVGEYKLSDFRILLFKEEDIKTSPHSFSLTPDKIKTLMEVESDSSNSWLSGATYVGKGNGSYIKFAESCGEDSIYKYVGYPNGDYNVSFTNVGLNNGDYKFDPLIGGYSYVGDSNGSYVPKLRVPLPYRNILFNLDYNKELNKLKIGLECAFTKFTPNTFTSTGRSGKAFIGGFETNMEKWGLGGSFRNIDASFCFPGTVDTLSSNIGELFSFISPFPFLTTSVRLIGTRVDLLKNLEFCLTPLKLPHFSYKYLIGKTDRTSEFFLSYRISLFEPFVRYKVINELSNSGDLKEIGVSSGWLKLVLEEDELSNSRTSSVCIFKSPLNLSYTKRQAFGSTHKSAIDLGTLNFSFSGLTIAYNLTSLERNLLKEEYYEVDTGKGSFSEDSLTQRYYPDPHGNYEKRLVPSGTSSICKNFSFSNTLILHPFSTVSFKLGSLKSGEGDKILFWGRSASVFDDRNRINWGLEASNFNISYTKDDFRENKIYGSPRSGGQDILCIDFYYSDIDFKYSTGHTKRWIHDNLDLDEKSVIKSIGLSHKIKSCVSLYSQFQFEQRLFKNPTHFSAEPDLHLSGYSYEPLLTYEFDNKELTGRVKLTLWCGPSDAPPDIMVIYPPGLSMECSLDLTLLSIKNTDYILSYQCNKRPVYPLEHMLNAEARINF
ncbi:MAG: hypothetical protein QMD71_05315 [bacterium]|nr:hypothetical protein [bacterium]